MASKMTNTPPDAGPVREVRDVPPPGVWARLVRADGNANTEFDPDSLVLLAPPGRAEVVDRFPGGAALAVFRTDRDEGGSVAPDGALVWVPAQAFARLPAIR